jgi:uncharacterized membrane protein
MFFKRGRRDEGGAILVMAAIGMVVAMISAGLAIDIGRLAQDARQDQKVADLAALDAVRVLPGVTDQTASGSVTMAAKDSATRNGFPYASSGYSFSVQWAASKAGPFTSNTANLATATVVKITATSPHTNDFPFLGGRTSVARSATAEKKNIAGFTLGSSLVNFNSSTSTLLNPIVGTMLGGTVNLSLVSWQGLAAGNVTLSALQTQLASMGFSVGTVSQLLNTNLTLAQIYQATAQALTANGDTANANLFNILRAQAVTATTIKLGQMITVEQGAESAAAAARLNLLQLVTGSAEIANGTNLISVPGVAITVPNVGSLALTLKVIDGPKTYIGTAGTGPHVTTGQVELNLIPQVNILNLLGLVKVTGAFPIEVHAAGATGTLKSIACPSKNIVVTADPAAFSGVVKSSSLAVTTLGLLPLLTVDQSNVTAAVDGPAQDIPFTYSADFSPPNNVSKHIGSQPIGLQTLNNISGTATNINALNLLTVGLSSGGVLTAVLSSLDTIVGDLDNLVLTPLFKALGIDIGGADVTALGADAFGLGLPSCGLPGLAS